MNRETIAVSGVALLAFLAWLWYAPRPEAPAQQVIVATGACCPCECDAGDSEVPKRPAPGTATFDGLLYAPPALTLAPAATPGAQLLPGRDPKNQHAPAQGIYGGTIWQSVDGWWPSDAGYACAPAPASSVSAAHPCGVVRNDVADHKPIPASEPPAWPLFLAGVAGVGICVWANRRDQK